jgi:GH24 family phage-related lysozyme (muramidase)
LAVLRITTKHIVIGAGVLAAVVLLMPTFKTRLINTLASFIPSVEGFEPHPYWDVSRYSWGYGTRAPGSTGTISREQAFADMLSYLLSDYSLLAKKITRHLTVGQWAALLSFSYNLGNDDALDLVPYINANNDEVLHSKWMQYVHSGGQVNSVLVDRRGKEWALWVG